MIILTASIGLFKLHFIFSTPGWFGKYLEPSIKSRWHNYVDLVQKHTFYYFVGGHRFQNAFYYKGE